jgi:hypothetical protein
MAHPYRLPGFCLPGEHDFRIEEYIQRQEPIGDSKNFFHWVYLIKHKCRKCDWIKFTKDPNGCRKDPMYTWPDDSWFAHGSTRGGLA